MNDYSDYGFLKHFKIDLAASKNVLITGANSYIGESFRKYALRNYPNLQIDVMDLLDASWRHRSFSGYDTVFHVAGIAHADVGHIDAAAEKKYYEVNTDLAVETARKAKTERVKQFVFMSSMIIYGEAAPCGKRKVITEKTEPAPANCYGASKWQADQKIRKLSDNNFHVCVLRPPMIYGKGSKGNYPLLASLAKKMPFFPAVENERSMLYIDNLCEFLCRIILSGESGVYFPQNREYTQTVQMVQRISAVYGKKIWVNRIFNPVVRVVSHIPGILSRLANKAFGSIVYD